MNTKDNIEHQEIIAEAKAGSYQPVRFTRIKYKDNPNPLIDIRIFQRGYDKDGEEAYYPTKKGFQFLESEFGKVVKSWTLLPSTYVHQDVMDKSFELLAKRQFESAVLQVFRCVEIKIREKGNYSQDEHGVSLIRKAFHIENGTLTNLSLPRAEREAMSNYIAGAYGMYKNPCSHREVKFEFLEAFEQIVIASNIVKLIEKAGINKQKVK